jgi:hypothetical protein
VVNENNFYFYPRDMFEFIDHPKCGCCGHKGLMNMINSNNLLLFAIAKVK